LKLATHAIDGKIHRQIDDSKLNIAFGQEYSRNFGKVELAFNDNKVNVLGYLATKC
jgi:hypothetical protein